MDVYLTNLIFFNVLFFVIIVLMSIQIFRKRDTLFLPVNRGVPYWFNPEDSIDYNKVIVNVVKEDVCPKPNVDIYSVKSSSEFVPDDFEEMNRTLESLSVPKKRGRPSSK